MANSLYKIELEYNKKCPIVQQDFGAGAEFTGGELDEFSYQK
jgi:hypothetical protein